jgi:CDP-paratose 2-epimerase
MVQEYGRYFGMPTVCFRGGCLTGPNHSGSELHGFLAYMARCFRERRKYRIFGYKAKQVRDNIHSYDVCSAIHLFCERPMSGAVYNLGGGRENSVSILEALAGFSDRFGRTIETEYIDENRAGDHVCYITDLRSFRTDYPDWSIQITLAEILTQLTKGTEMLPDVN